MDGYPTPEHVAAVKADPQPLTERLRGVYTNVGGARTFFVPPIQIAAADEIDELRATFKAVAVMVYNSRYAGYDRAWVRSQIAGIADELARAMMLVLDQKARGEA